MKSRKIKTFLHLLIFEIQLWVKVSPQLKKLKKKWNSVFFIQLCDWYEVNKMLLHFIKKKKKMLLQLLDILVWLWLSKCLQILEWNMFLHDDFGEGQHTFSPLFLSDKEPIKFNQSDEWLKLEQSDWYVSKWFFFYFFIRNDRLK